jgi:hypothetical protein
MKKVYIAHPFTTYGDPEENFSKQVSLCKKVFSFGYIPVSPILTFGRCIPHDEEHYQTAMDACFWLLSACDEAWFYGEWEKSKGCKLEYDFAKSLGIPCHSNLPDGTICFMKLIPDNEDIQLLPNSVGNTSNTEEPSATV